MPDHRTEPWPYFDALVRQLSSDVALGLDPFTERFTIADVTMLVELIDTLKARVVEYLEDYRRLQDRLGQIPGMAGGSDPDDSPPIPGSYADDGSYPHAPWPEPTG